MGYIQTKIGTSNAYRTQRVDVLADGEGTMPGPDQTVPICLVICTQPAYQSIVKVPRPVAEQAAAQAAIDQRSAEADARAAQEAAARNAAAGPSKQGELGELPVITVRAVNPTKSQVRVLGGWKTAFDARTPWAVVSARVQHTRYYAASTAKVVLSYPISELDGDIPPPGLTLDEARSTFFQDRNSFRSQELRPEMAIEIYMGYVRSLEEGFYEDPKHFTVDPRKFTKVFHGVIDTVSLKLGRGENPADGVTCTISARDNLRYLIDNKFFGELSIPGEDFTSEKGVSRTKIIEYLIAQGSGYAVKPALDPLFHSSGRPPMVIAPLSNLAKTGSASDRTTVIVNSSIPFSIPDQFPVDVIRWFSAIETLPRELWCDIETGDIAWTVRMLGEVYNRTDDQRLFGDAAITQGVDYTILTSMDSLLGQKAVLADLILKNRADDKSMTAAQAETLAHSIANRLARCYGEVSLSGNRIAGPTMALGIMHLATAGTFNPAKRFGPPDDEREGLGGFTAPMANMISLSTSWGGPGVLYGAGGRTDPDLTVPAIYRFLGMVYFDEVFVPGSRLGPGRRTAEIDQPIDRLQRMGIIASVNDAIAMAATAFAPGMDGHRVYEVLEEIVASYAVTNEIRGLAAMQRGSETISYERFLSMMDRLGYKAGLTYWSELSKTHKIYHYNNVFKFMYYRDWEEAAAALPGEAAKGSVAEVDLNRPGIHRGVGDPWVYSYKRSVQYQRFSRDGLSTIRPNILSAHADWSTLGVITKLVLLNPVPDSLGKGGARIRATQSLFGRPNILGDNGEVLIANHNNTRVRMSDAHITHGEVAESPTDVSVPLIYANKIRFPVRTRYVWDESADDRLSLTIADIILNGLLNIYGTDIRAVDLLVYGNPDIRPGHVVQAHNLGFFDGEQLRVEGVTHLFATGGVNAGYTTMLVGVGTQGSYDPHTIPAMVANILRFQGIGKPDDIPSASRRAGASSATGEVGLEDPTEGRSDGVEDEIHWPGWESSNTRRQLFTDGLDALRSTLLARSSMGWANLAATQDALEVLDNFTDLERICTQYFFCQTAGSYFNVRSGVPPEQLFSNLENLINDEKNMRQDLEAHGKYMVEQLPTPDRLFPTDSDWNTRYRALRNMLVNLPRTLDAEAAVFLGMTSDQSRNLAILSRRARQGLPARAVDFPGDPLEGAWSGPYGNPWDGDGLYGHLLNTFTVSLITRHGSTTKAGAAPAFYEDPSETAEWFNPTLLEGQRDEPYTVGLQYAWMCRAYKYLQAHNRDTSGALPRLREIIRELGQRWATRRLLATAPVEVDLAPSPVAHVFEPPPLPPGLDDVEA